MTTFNDPFLIFSKSNNIPIQDVYITAIFHGHRTKNKKVIADLIKSRKLSKESLYGSLGLENLDKQFHYYYPLSYIVSL